MCADSLLGVLEDRPDRGRELPSAGPALVEGTGVIPRLLLSLKVKVLVDADVDFVEPGKGGRGNSMFSPVNHFVNGAVEVPWRVLKFPFSRPSCGISSASATLA